MPSNGDKPIDRRKFFRLGLSELLRPLAAVTKPLQHITSELDKLERLIREPMPAKPRPSPAGKPNIPVLLRPPGSLQEQLFRETCSRSGECVKVCPAQAIKIDSTGAHGGGAPYIDADEMPCVVCTGLQCMSVCPSGALVRTSINNIDMGTAVWNQRSCLRTEGEECTICVDKCPLGSAAIELKENRVAVNPLGCIGCGVCQHECPTSPKSITVIPVSAKTAR